MVLQLLPIGRWLRASCQVPCRQELLRGPLLYIVVVIAVTVLFWRESPVGLIVLSLMCGGDGLADIVGRQYGSAKLPFNVDKSWAGSLAMFSGKSIRSIACSWYVVNCGHQSFVLTYTCLALSTVDLLDCV